jgi:hypothetical protein
LLDSQDVFGVRVRSFSKLSALSAGGNILKQICRACDRAHCFLYVFDANLVFPYPPIPSLPNANVRVSIGVALLASFGKVDADDVWWVCVLAPPSVHSAKRFSGRKWRPSWVLLALRSPGYCSIRSCLVSFKLPRPSLCSCSVYRVLSILSSADPIASATASPTLSQSAS